MHCDFTYNSSKLGTMSAQDVNNTRFNAEAADWDANVKHVESCHQAFESIKRLVPAFADGRSGGRVTG